MFGKLKPAKNAVFVLQVSDTLLKALKYSPSAGAKQQYAFYSEPLPSGAGADVLTEKIVSALHKIGYSRGSLVISLPRSQAIFRYIKIPSQNRREIEKIAGLQAARQLPYPAGEVVSGFDVVGSDRAGYSDIAQVVVHRETVQRYAELFKKLRISPPKIILSSCGLSNLYARTEKQQQEGYPEMVIDIDAGQVELAIVSKGRLLFSRAAALNLSKPDWQAAVITEMEKTVDAFSRESGRENIVSGIALTGNPGAISGLKGALAAHFGLPVKIIDHGMPTENNEISFACLIGLGYGDVGDSFDLLTADLKKERAGVILKKELQQAAALSCGAVLVFGLAFSRDIDNKARQLAMLKGELSRVGLDAKMLEGLDRRMRFIESRNKDRLTVLTVLHEVNQACPADISLAYFYYGQARQLVLRGQAKELASVFAFVSRLEKTPLLKRYGLKVKYATKKRSQAGEAIDFEIAGAH